MSLTSMLLTGTPDGLQNNVGKLNKDIEKLPYENFPFCCGKKREDVSGDREINFA